MQVYYNFLDSQLKEIVDLVRSDLSELDRLTLGALVVMDVHAKDVIKELVDKRVNNVNEFSWLS